MLVNKSHFSKFIRSLLLIIFSDGISAAIEPQNWQRNNEYTIKRNFFLDRSGIDIDNYKVTTLDGIMYDTMIDHYVCVGYTNDLFAQWVSR